MPKAILTEVLADGRTSIPSDVLDILGLDAGSSLSWNIDGQRISVGSGSMPCAVDAPEEFWGGIAAALADIGMGRHASRAELGLAPGAAQRDASPRKAGHALRVTRSFADDVDVALRHYEARAGSRCARPLTDWLDSLCRVAGLLPRQGANLGGTRLWWRPVGPFAAIYLVDEVEGSIWLLRLYNRASRGCEGILDDARRGEACHAEDRTRV